MKLTRFTDDLLSSGKKIIAIGRGSEDLCEFCSRYDTAGRIAFFLTDNMREQKDCVIDGYTRSSRDLSFFDSFMSDKETDDLIFIIMDDYYREVYETIECPKDLTIYYYLNYENEIEYSYREKYKGHELEDIIVFRSGPHASQYVHGMDFADNARALFEYMLDAALNERYELVWLVKDPAEFTRFDDVKNVKFLSFEWATNGTKDQMDEYYRVMCLSRYIFFTDAYGFARNCRSDQVRVQLWHGCGFKTRVNFTRCERRYELMPVISPVYKEIHKDIYGLRDDQVIVTGYPKEDWLFHPVTQPFSELFGAPAAKCYIMWMPTFREARGQLDNLNEYSVGRETGLPVADTREKLERLNELLVSKNTVIIVKLHPFQKRERVDCKGFSNIVLVENEDLDKMDIPINRILGKADALISDYSSAAIDYLILDRPIGFLLDDVEKYENSRGFVFEPIRKWLPGAELFDFEDMMTFVSEVSEGGDPAREKRRRLRKVLHSFSDDKSCERLVKQLHLT